MPRGGWCNIIHDICYCDYDDGEPCFYERTKEEREKPVMAEDDPLDFAKLFEQLRKSASVQAGAVMFGQAQVAYYDTLKEHMSEEMAYNLLAHTTEHILRSIASAAAPVAEVLLKMSVLFGKVEPETDKEVPGGS